MNINKQLRIGDEANSVVSSPLLGLFPPTLRGFGLEDSPRESLGILDLNNYEDFGRDSLFLIGNKTTEENRESLGILNLDDVDLGRESMGFNILPDSKKCGVLDTAFLESPRDISFTTENGKSNLWQKTFFRSSDIASNKSNTGREQGTESLEVLNDHGRSVFWRGNAGGAKICGKDIADGKKFVKPTIVVDEDPFPVYNELLKCTASTVENNGSENFSPIPKEASTEKYSPQQQELFTISKDLTKQLSLTTEREIKTANKQNMSDENKSCNSPNASLSQMLEKLSEILDKLPTEKDKLEGKDLLEKIAIRNASGGTSSSTNKEIVSSNFEIQNHPLDLRAASTPDQSVPLNLSLKSHDSGNNVNCFKGSNVKFLTPVNNHGTIGGTKPKPVDNRKTMKGPMKATIPLNRASKNAGGFLKTFATSADLQGSDSRKGPKTSTPDIRSILKPIAQSTPGTVKNMPLAVPSQKTVPSVPLSKARKSYSGAIPREEQSKRTVIRRNSTGDVNKPELTVGTGKPARSTSVNRQSKVLLENRKQNLLKPKEEKGPIRSRYKSFRGEKENVGCGAARK